jgi:hypothetical protein
MRPEVGLRTSFINREVPPEQMTQAVIQHLRKPSFVLFIYFFIFMFKPVMVATKQKKDNIKVKSYP